MWRLNFRGREALFADGKGMRDLATLLAAPGREITVAELLSTSGPPPGADDVLDGRAHAAYQQQLAELSAELDNADRTGDRDRAVSAIAERDFLIRELSAATGFGGRARRLGSEAEKGRKTVTARLRHTISRIAHAHPQLAEDLDASIRTGAHCSYQPPEPVTWELNGIVTRR
jgi:hypothetical protein